MVSTDLFIKSNLSCCVEFIFFAHIFLCHIIIYSYFLNPFEHSVALVTLTLHLITVYFSLLYYVSFPPDLCLSVLSFSFLYEFALQNANERAAIRRASCLTFCLLLDWRRK